MKADNFFLAVLLASTTGLFASTAARAQATIDQNKALAGSVTPGDGPGFPVTLSVPGSYKLTGNLVVPAGPSGIVVTATGVTLDLNGFNIGGPITCSRNGATASVTCSAPTATNYGVEFTTGGNVVRNGSVRGFSTGVRFLGADLLENLLVEQNFSSGVQSPSFVGARTLIRGVRVQLNGGHGMVVSATLVQGSTSAANGGHGLYGGRTVVYDSVSVDNKGAGFTGNNIVVGRTQSEGNKGGNYVSTVSAGNNVDGTSSVPF